MTGSDPVWRHVDEDECLDLLHGFLGKEDEARVLDHAAACPACERLFRSAVVAFESGRGAPPLVRDGVGRLTLAQPRPPVARRGPAPGRRPRPGRAAWAGLGLAAAVAAVLLVVWQPGGDESGAAYWIPADRALVGHRAGASAEGAFEAGRQSYDLRDASTAIEKLRRVRAEGAYEILRRVYLASALLNDARPEEAIDELEGLSLLSVPEPWRSDARWILALAFLRTDRPELAREPLEAIAAGDGALARPARDRLKEIGR